MHRLGIVSQRLLREPLRKCQEQYRKLFKAFSIENIPAGQLWPRSR